ncbi:hypothetical protein JHK87_020155 [Glycine soja]|nr:hypothetical protein JHK87_020155 [Glycine soja]
MGVPQPPPPSQHLYPQEIQLKLYQAFIFSIPILFSIILVLLFYLFYLKRRASSLSSPPLHILPSTSTDPQTAYPYSTQIPYCNHVFHISCICNWLQSNSTCPLCRCSIIPSSKFLNPAPPIIISDPPQQGGISGSSSHIMSLPHQQEEEVGASTNTTIFQGNDV